MKSPTLFLASSLLLSPAALLAQTGPDRPPSPSHVAAATPIPGTGEIRRIERESASNLLTARNLIGKAVVNTSGQRLGSVSDVSLGTSLDEHFSRPGRAPSTLAASETPLRHLELHVTVGGVLGVGGNRVSVPLNRVEYDRTNDQFILDLAQNQLSAIAEGDLATAEAFAAAGQTRGTIGTGPATTPAPRDEVLGRGATTTETQATRDGVIGATSTPEYATRARENDAERAIGRSAADGPRLDLRRIEDALRREAGPAVDLRDITLAFSGNTVLLSGSVRDESHSQRIEQIARAQTDLEVRNLLQVAPLRAAE